MFLEKINTPADVKKLSIEDLKTLCEEIRERILEVVSRNGGHLAPSLGAVELIVALHYVFHSPRDKLIFDVGHQAYAHKLLTGRKDRFDTLRKREGISGFLKRSESEHDVFGAGHASTSLAAALGFAVARDLEGKDYEVVAIVGDGALTGGLSWEALNNIGHLGKKVVVVLNDNEMSISKSIGAISEYLSRIRTEPSYLKIKEDLEFVLRRIPLGLPLWEGLQRLKDAVKHIFVPGMIFEELGFTYLGPIDGHNLEALIEIFLRAKNLSGPTLIHITTKKGKGYEPAEMNPEKFHGVPPFDLETGTIFEPSFPPTYTEVFAHTLTSLAEKDEKIIAITAAMPLGTGLSRFAERFPNRFFDVGMGEACAVTFAAGLACQGFKPVVAIYSTFLQRAYDMIIHDVCLQNLPVVFAIDRAGIVGEDGATHQGIFDIAYLLPIPNIVVSAPADEWELASLIKTSLQANSPFAIRYPREKGIGVPYDNPQILPIGKGELRREGKDLCIIAIGSMVYPAERAAKMLEEEGISPSLINPRFLKPFDEELILSCCEKAKRVLVVEEGILWGGFGSFIAQFLLSKGLTDIKVKLVGIEGFVEHGKREELLQLLGLTPEGIYHSAKELLKQ
ncbi:MAG: 1-deoxy-D-xylulose-5-phosphate synthase [bacterium]